MSADEFDIIRDHFAPLAQDPAARGLIDDAAVLAARGDIVVTTDTVVEGVHFLADDPIHFIAKKALRVSLSDLAAKGAQPIGALLALIWPETREAREITRFAEGLKEDLLRYRTPLIGGDTTSTSGPLTLTITALGAPYGPRVPSRADAIAGDDVWITGVIGDSWLGLQARRGQLRGLPADSVAMLALRYQLPDPPISFGTVIAEHAHAAMDVSDGLVADARKLAKASHAAIELEAPAIPLSEPAQAWLSAAGAGRLSELICGGDDYEILFTAAPDRRVEITAAARVQGVRATRIGRVSAGAGVTVRDAAGAPLRFASAGHSHKLGA